MAKLKYKLTNDMLFRLFFVKFPKYLKRFIAAVLELGGEGIHAFEVLNPNIHQDALGKKYCRMDINVMVNNMVINIEMQRKASDVYRARSLFYWSKNYAQVLKEGEGYEKLLETIAINILEESLFDGPKYHSEFHVLEKVEHTRLTDRLCLHFLELSKLPELTEGDSELLLWLHLFNAKTDEDLSQIVQKGGSFMAEVTEAYTSLMASDELQELRRLTEKAGHDEASARYEAKNEKAAEIAKGLLEDGVNMDIITRRTGLTVEDILKL